MSEIRLTLKNTIKQITGKQKSIITIIDFKYIIIRVPESEDTIAAKMKDSTTAGPATDLATVPANT